MTTFTLDQGAAAWRHFHEVVAHTETSGVWRRGENIKPPGEVLKGRYIYFKQDDDDGPARMSALCEVALHWQWVTLHDTTHQPVPRFGLEEPGAFRHDYDLGADYDDYM